MSIFIYRAPIQQVFFFFYLCIGINLANEIFFVHFFYFKKLRLVQKRSADNHFVATITQPTRRHLSKILRQLAPLSTFSLFFSDTLRTLVQPSMDYYSKVSLGFERCRRRLRTSHLYLQVFLLSFLFSLSSRFYPTPPLKTYYKTSYSYSNPSINIAYHPLTLSTNIV